MTKKETLNTNKFETIIVLISACIFLIVVATIAIVVVNESQKVERTLTEQTEEDIKFNNEKLNVYLFYGDGCPHCEELIEFLNKLPEKYNDYFDLYTLEVWYNLNNNDLMTNLLAELNEDPEGVPCLIIGNQVFFGYSTSMEQELKKAIKEESEKANKFDVYQQYNT